MNWIWSWQKIQIKLIIIQNICVNFSPLVFNSSFLSFFISFHFSVCIHYSNLLIRWYNWNLDCFGTFWLRHIQQIQANKFKWYTHTEQLFLWLHLCLNRGFVWAMQFLKSNCTVWIIYWLLLLDCCLPVGKQQSSRLLDYFTCNISIKFNLQFYVNTIIL